MKRTLSLLLVLVLLAGLFPTALAASAPVTSSNINDHFYINAGRFYHPIYSNLAWENGSYVRAEAIGSNLVVETYDQDFNFLSGKTIELELPVFGGVRMDTDYNFVVVGQENPTEDDSVEVFRIIRYTKDWKKVDHASLFGANTYIPFDAGSLRFDRSGDILYIRTAHEMYDTGDGLHHQANVMISVRISDMTVTDELTRVLNRNYGYVSHSFNQFVRVDGDTLLAVDHGDALPRSVVLFKYPYKAGSETFYGKTTMVNVLPIADSTYHYNDTGVSVGGFECSSTDYLVAGSAYDMSEEVDLMYAHRNIFVTATPKNNFTDEGTVLHWLTDYSEADGVEVSPPHMLKVSADKFLLTWTEDGTLKYCFVNGKGQLDGSVKTMSGSLSDCVPIRVDRYAVWYVTNGSAPKFYRIELEACVHSYTSKVTAPTCTERGYTTHTCTSCGDSYVDSYTAALGHSYGEWYTVQEPTCSASGTQRRDCTRCDAYETGSLEPVDHDYRSTVTDPTCTDQGYTTHTCSRCSDRYVDSYTAALGHEYRDYKCIRCEELEPMPFEDVRQGDYYHIPVMWAVDNGITTGATETTFAPEKNATRAEVITFIWRANGEPEPTSTHNPFTDVKEGRFYYKAVLWAVEQGITTGTSATTFSPHDDCSRCQVVAFLWRVEGEPEAEYNDAFDDVAEGKWYAEPISWALEKGITTGISENEFGVHVPCNRAQIVTFLYRAYAK